MSEDILSYDGKCINEKLPYSVLTVPRGATGNSPGPCENTNDRVGGFRK